MTASGIVLHGSLSVPPWPPPHVRFEKDPWSSTGEPEYEALKTWVPGGAVREYQWHFHPTTLMETIGSPGVGAPAPGESAVGVPDGDRTAYYRIGAHRIRGCVLRKSLPAHGDPAWSTHRGGWE